MRAERKQPHRSLLVLVLVLVLGACADLDVQTEELAVGDVADFELQVQPQLLDRCGSGGCHARRARPFSLYRPGALRMDAARTFLDEPLTQAESAANALHAAAFALDAAPEDSLLLCKPLARSEHGCAHGGGDVFTSTGDPLYRALLTWLQARAAADAGAP